MCLIHHKPLLTDSTLKTVGNKYVSSSLFGLEDLSPNKGPY